MFVVLILENCTIFVSVMVYVHNNRIVAYCVPALWSKPP